MKMSANTSLWPKFSWLMIICLCTFVLTSPAQEYLVGLTGNKQFQGQHQTSVQYKNIVSGVYLPFLDDFSNYSGYPKGSLWQDKQAFVNQGFSIAPPTLGVVTLDALDQNGRIYEHARSTSFPADTLTSLPIRLDSLLNPHRKIKIQDSLYFSFYYQPGGAVFPQTGTPTYREWERVGDVPETDDSLVLEFGYATGKIVFVGYKYSDYVLRNDFITGDTLWNPYILGDYFIFSEYRQAGDTIQLPSDSLFGPEMVWNHVWSTPGYALDAEYDKTKQYFKQVMIPITDPQYLRNNFQFRFRNYASLEGNGITGWASNVDQWHIDYVYLNINRQSGDIYPNDVAFVSPANSLLSKYQAMPWSQFRPTDLRTSFSNVLSNLSNKVKNTNYSYTAVKNGKTNVGEYQSNNENASPFYTNGWHTYAAHATPSVSINIPADLNDSAVVVVTHIFQVEGGTGDECHANDTCRCIQKFHNYYAYDDGTAEAGYSIVSIVNKPEIFLAMRYELAEPDTLRSVRMWFNHVQNDENMDYFTLMVWGDNHGVPGEVLYSMESQLPRKAEDFFDFVDYYTDPVAISGTFYVGFFQNHNIQLNIGFDANNDGREHFMYMTDGSWKKPILKGVPMIRPVVGKALPNTGVREVRSQTCRIFPNPASSFVDVMLPAGQNYSNRLELFDIQGRLLQSVPVEQNSFDEVKVRVNLNDVPAGIYMLKVGNTVSKVVKK